MKAINIKWDVDNRSDLEYLPKEIEIPQEIINDTIAWNEDVEETVSDYITDFTGFCHFGFDLDTDS